jgi:hypothetical protein
MHLVTSGDSWSKGEWDIINKKHTVSHQGINQYFADDGYKVVNLHGFSNKISIKKLEKYLETNSPDVILYFFTDPFRDFTDPSNSSIFYKISKTLTSINNFQDMHEKLINDTLKKLDSLNKKIYVLGGCQRLEKRKFNNIEIFLESVSEFICNDYKHPKFWDSGWSFYIDFKNLDKKFFYFIEEQNKLQWNMLTDQYASQFRPDGFHPNRHGHYKLYKFLKENINEFE